MPLAVLCLTTMLVIGTHLRMVPRYYMQITPLLVFFVAMLFLYVVRWVATLLARHFGHRPTRPLSLTAKRITAVLAAAPFLWLAVFHATDLPRRVDAAQAFNDSGAVQRGPLEEQNQVAMEAIEKYTRPDDIVTYYRARTATLYTGRRALQTTSFDNMAGQQRLVHAEQDRQLLAGRGHAPPSSRRRGFELVWEDDDWRLWRVPEGPVKLAEAASPDVQPLFNDAPTAGSPP